MSKACQIKSELLQINNVWIVGLSYGSLEFLTNIDTYGNLHEINITQEDILESNSSEEYIIEGRDLLITSDGGLISAINVKDKIFYNDINLIGLTIREFEELFKSQPDAVGVSADGDFVEYDDGSLETCYEFDALGAQVWVTDLGIITTVVVMPIFADNDMKVRIFPDQNKSET